MAYDTNNREKDDGTEPYQALTQEPAGMTASAASTPSLPGQAGASGPQGVGKTATGFVNFGDVYQANAGAAEQGAKRLQTSAQQKAGTFQQGLTGAARGFNDQVHTGSQTGPTQQQQDWAKYGQTGVQHGKVVTGAQLNPDDGKAHTGAHQQQSVTEQQQGLEGGEQPLIGNPDLPPGDPNQTSVEAPSQVYDRENDAAAQAAQEAAVRSGAAGGYSGPDSLSSDSDAYLKLATEAADAQDYATALGSGNQGLEGMGMNATDAAMLGAAGRPDFARLAQRYGNMKGELEQVNNVSQQTANDARQQSQDAASAYQSLLDQHEGRKTDEQAQEDAAQQRSDAIYGNAQGDADKKAAFQDYLHGGTEGDHARNTIHDIGKAISPSEWVTGDAGLVNLGTNAISPMSSTNTGNVWGGWSDSDGDVWGSMTDSDWADFAKLSDAGKHQWIEERRKKLQGGG